jgi:hypothetical protein
VDHDAIAAPLARNARPRRRPVVLALVAVTAALLVPLVYSGGLAYGASWLEWDDTHATYYYAERPGGFVVLALSWLLVLLLASAALLLAALAIIDATRRRR